MPSPVQNHFHYPARCATPAVRRPRFPPPPRMHKITRFITCLTWHAHIDPSIHLHQRLIGFRLSAFGHARRRPARLLLETDQILLHVTSCAFSFGGDGDDTRASRASLPFGVSGKKATISHSMHRYLAAVTAVTLQSSIVYSASFEKKLVSSPSFAWILSSISSRSRPVHALACRSFPYHHWLIARYVSIHSIQG